MLRRVVEVSVSGEKSFKYEGYSPFDTATYKLECGHTGICMYGFGGVFRGDELNCPQCDERRSDEEEEKSEADGQGSGERKGTQNEH